MRDPRMISRCAWVLCLLWMGLWAGCQGTSPAARRAANPAAYAVLPAEWRPLVNAGKICEGMDTNAVFFAWGPPSEVQSGTLNGGSWATWSYTERGVREIGYWEWEQSTSTRPGGMEYRRAFEPISFLGTSVVFEGGKVVRWRRHSTPTN
jgi:hypothetical protein